MADTTPFRTDRATASSTARPRRSAAERTLRAEIVRTAQRMNELGINQGTSGNVSARWNDGFLVTPSGVPYPDCTGDDLVWMGFDGTVRGRLRPSSEWRFHLDIYRARPEAQAVVHTHAIHATAIAAHRRSIPAFHYMVALAGGTDIRCAGYATYGTQRLSDAALAALAGRRACLLANHGVIALGESLAKALRLAEEVETLARMYLAALQMGEPIVLDDAEMAVVLDRFGTYGQASPEDGFA
jgi:L-fuculose-phosphate aldolase